MTAYDPGTPDGAEGALQAVGVAMDAARRDLMGCRNNRKGIMVINDQHPVHQASAEALAAGHGTVPLGDAVLCDDCSGDLRS